MREDSMAGLDESSIVVVDIPAAAAGRRGGCDGSVPAGAGAGAGMMNRIAPAQQHQVMEEEVVVDRRRADTGNLAGKLAKLLFFFHLFALSVLVLFLSLRGFLENRSFRPLHWHLPLLASAVAAAAAAAAWLLLTLRRPFNALKASLWLGPSLTCLAGFLLMAAGDGVGLAFAVIFLASSLALGLYACRLSPRLEHARKVFDACLPAVHSSTATLAKLTAIALLAGVGYCWFWALGVAGVAAHGDPLSPLYVVVLLLSIAWTANVIRNILLVAVARVAFMQLAYDLEVDARQAFGDAGTRSLSSVCLGSAVAPAVGVLRGTARAMAAAAGVSDWLAARANRWGFVQVGAYGKGFVEASGVVWEMFAGRDMVTVVDSDVTEAFCFMAGMCGGAAAALLGGSWAVAVDKGYATGVAIYSFLAGYFLVRVAMAWPQACVSAYYVAYATNPKNNRLGTAIPDRIQELR